MLKKIYSLLASILLLSGCAADDIMQEKNPVDDSKVALSFQVDVPSAAVITKSTSVPVGEVGIENLKLVTFDGNNNLIETVSATVVNGNNYSAVVSKETRKIQFVANYDGYESINSVTAASTAATNEYVFFKELSIADGATALGPVKLLRNWSKISLTDNSGALTNVQFMVYNASTKATVAPGSGNINVPSGNVLNTNPTFINAGTDIHTFEQSTSGDSPAFVIVKALFNGSETYYKLDLAVTDPATGIVTNYDIMRNYWYNITISEVQRKGVSWDEVIKPGKIADNNITASTELDKYPSIAFGGEKLEVTKTTYVFTAAGQTLNMLATYTKDNSVDYSGLTLVKNTENLSDVVNGNISMSNESGSGRIRANIKAPSSGEKVTYFYVKGGNLQRKITLILRNPYQFENVRFYKSNDVDGDNKITQGPDQAINFAFTIPESVDESIFPLECKIKSKTLYAVTSGVRIEAAPEGDNTYYYVYTAKQAGRHIVQFKTNATVTGETAELTAENFSMAKADYVTDAPLLMSGTAKYGTTGFTTTRNIDGTVSYTIKGSKKSFTVNSGTYSNVAIDRNLADNTEVTFTYAADHGLTYTVTMTVGEWKNNRNIVLRTDDGVYIFGDVTGGSSSWNGYTVKYNINVDKNYPNNFKCGSGGSYSIILKNVKETDRVYFYYKGGNTWKSNKTVADLIKDGDIQMKR